MARNTITSSVHSLSSAANQIGCAPGTLRRYVKDGSVQCDVTPSGHYIFQDKHVAQAQRVFERGVAKRANR